MRALLLLVFLIAPAAAHDVGEGWNHLQPWQGTLAGESHARNMSFDGGDLQAGWWWLLHAEVEGDPIDVRLGSQTWSLDAGIHDIRYKLEETGRPTLNVASGGNSSFTIYYDQTCDCSFKGIHTKQGPLWFNWMEPAGREVEVTFTLTPSRTTVGAEPPLPERIDVDLIHYVDDGGLKEVARAAHGFSTSDGMCHDLVRWNGCFTYTWKSDGQEALLWMDITHGSDWALMVSPVSESKAIEEAPLPVVLVLVALAIAFLRRR